MNDILDECQQPLRFRANLARKRRYVLRLGNAARDDLRVTHDAGQRRFQFVRHIGCKFLPLLLGTLTLGNIHDQQHGGVPCAVLLHRACRKFINAAVPLEFSVRAFAVERLLDHLNVIRIAAQRQIAAFRTVMREQRPRSVIGEQNHALAGKQYQTFIHTGRNVVKLSLTALQLVHLRLNFVVLLVHAVQQRRQLVIGFALHRLMQVERFDRLEEQTGQPACQHSCNQQRQQDDQHNPR